VRCLHHLCHHRTCCTIEKWSIIWIYAPRQAIPAARMDFTTLGMIMQTIGLFYDAARKREVRS
jgi:hypothetical protein